MGQSRVPSKPSSPEPAPNAIRIDALGGLRVSVGDRELGLFNQPYRCALLLYLAVENRTTRAAITDLFWPDKDPPRARRSLSQTLYELKRDLRGAPLLETVGDEIEVIESVDVDVTHFLQAVRDGDADTAISLYQGPFLGDVHLPTTVPFERWSEQLRLRLQRSYGKICHTRLAELEREQQWGPLADLAREWTEREQLKDEAWHYLILGLWKTGRSREALASYEWLRAALNRELDLTPVEQTQALVAAIREEVDGPAVTQEGGRPALPVPETLRARAPRSPSSTTRWPWIAAGIAAAVVGGFLMTRSGPPAASVAGEARVIAVAPMAAIGDVSEDLTFGIPSLLASVLDQLDDVRTLGPSSYASAAAANGLSGQTEEVQRIGQVLNANSALTGTLTSVSGMIRGEVVLKSAETGGTVAYASATALPDSASQLVDSLAIKLMRDLWRTDEALPTMRVAAISSADPQALRHFLRGERYRIQATWDSASAAYGLATLADPDFALARYRGADVSRWGRMAFVAAPTDELIEAAYQDRERLPVRERALIRVSWLDLQGRIEALDSAAAFIVRYPDDVEGRYGLGDVRTHAWKLVPNTPFTLLEPFDRALGLEQRLVQFYVHPLQISASIGDLALFDGYHEGFRRHTVESDRRFAGWREALWGTAEESVNGWRQALESAGRGPLSPLLQGFLLHGDAPIDSVVALLAEHADRPGHANVRRRQLLVQALTATGRIAEASAALLPMFDLDPFAASVGAAHLAAATGRASEAVERARDYLRSRPDDRLHRIWASWIELSLGNATQAREIVESWGSEQGERVASREPVDALCDATAGWLALLTGDVADGLERMERGLEAAGYAHATGPLTLAWERALARSPEYESKALERFRFARPDLEYVIPRTLEHIELLRSRGEYGDIEALERRVRRLMKDADLDMVRPLGRQP